MNPHRWIGLGWGPKNGVPPVLYLSARIKNRFGKLPKPQLAYAARLIREKAEALDLLICDTMSIFTCPETFIDRDRSMDSLPDGNARSAN
jgi:hypothetical protein